jgi:Osmosensitive K+ channel histidine kinase
MYNHINYSVPKLLRNPELLHSTALFAALIAVFSTIAYIWDYRFGIFTIIFGLIMLTIQFYTVFRRYSRLAALALDIDNVLDGKYAYLPEGYSEGELDILGGELYKLTVSLREQRERLQADKTRLSELLSDVSHQIRTPLATVNLLAESLARSGSDDERRAELALRLEALIFRIDRLLAATLKLARLDAGAVGLTCERCELGELVGRAVEPLRVLFELRGVSFDAECMGFANVDMLWTVEAVGNIIKNCAEHAPEGSTVKVRASENALYSEIEVSDEGPGINNADLQHIFERFYRCNNTVDSAESQPITGGFGIGLSLCQRIVNAQGGIVTACNKKEGGAVFTIKLYKITI